jgi:RNase P/RNase MRP subunit p29
MRWPDVFFKAKAAKTKPETTEKSPSPEMPAPVRRTVSQVSLPPAPVHPVSSDSHVVNDMAEADTLRQLTRSGGIRLVKRDFPATDAEKAEPASPPESPRGAPSINLAGPGHPEAPAATAVFGRRIRMADVARIVLPPRREEKPEEGAGTESSPAASAVIPPTFPVNMPAGTALNEPSPAAPEPIDADKSAPAGSPLASTSSGPENGKKREFVLSNGERIIGRVLSESPDSIYIDHATLGVMTIPRAQIAQRPVEIILINGDRIVGDVIAETSDSLFVRHASLGILTVPRNQRSNRVVEAILTDGDRILGEVLSETEDFTVIRSATLGTVAVPHQRLAMLNRRAEQVEMKSLPLSLENKREP